MKTIYNKINRTQMWSLVGMVEESFKDIGRDIEDVDREEFDECVLMLCENVGGLEMLSEDDIKEMTDEMYKIWLTK